MKLSRDELKNIVKEVLVEILSEGLNGSSHTISESRRVAQQHPKQQEVSTRSSIADKISFLPRQSAPPQARSIDKRALNEMTSDPIMQAMLADTAARGTPIIEESRTSNLAQEASVTVHGDAAAKAMQRSDPSDIFGSAASKWATLAFSEKKIGI